MKKILNLGERIRVSIPLRTKIDALSVEGDKIQLRWVYGEFFYSDLELYKVPVVVGFLDKRTALVVGQHCFSDLFPDPYEPMTREHLMHEARLEARFESRFELLEILAIYKDTAERMGKANLTFKIPCPEP